MVDLPGLLLCRNLFDTIDSTQIIIVEGVGSMIATSGKFPVSVKGVVTDELGRVLLGLKSRGDWELLGGRIELGEDPITTLRREVYEEAGLHVKVKARPTHVALFDVLDDGISWVFIAVFKCLGDSSVELRTSHEHEQLSWFEPDEAMTLEGFPSAYKEAIAATLREEDSRCCGNT